MRGSSNSLISSQLRNNSERTNQTPFMSYKSIMVSATLFACGTYFIYSKLNVECQGNHTMQKESINHQGTEHTHYIDNAIYLGLDWIKYNKETLLGGIFLLSGLIFVLYSIWSQKDEEYDEISGIPLKHNVR